MLGEDRSLNNNVGTPSKSETEDRLKWYGIQEKCKVLFEIVFLSLNWKCHISETAQNNNTGNQTNHEHGIILQDVTYDSRSVALKLCTLSFLLSAELNLVVLKHVTPKSHRCGALFCWLNLLGR